MSTLLTADLAAQHNEILHRIANLHQVSIAFAALAGSHAWGTQTPSSDFDIRFVYYRPQATYSWLDEGSDVLDINNCQIIKSAANESSLDIQGMDIRKFLRLARKGNSTAYEWCLATNVYVNNNNFSAAVLKILNVEFHQKAYINHYLGMATSDLAQIKRLGNDGFVSAKRVLSYLRSISIALYLYKFNRMPPNGLGHLQFEIVLNSSQTNVELELLNDTVLAINALRSNAVLETPKDYLDKLVSYSSIIPRDAVDAVPDMSENSKELMTCGFNRLISSL